MDRLTDEHVGEGPVISVVIPCRNHARELDRCLRSLARQCPAELVEIIVADSSSDDSAATAAAKHSGIRLYRSERRLMPGEARNFGAAKARGRFLAFIDADCVAEPNWIISLRAALESGHRIVGGAVLQGDPWNPVSIVDNLMQFVDLHPSRRNGASALLPSCNLAIPRSDFDAIGGFPELELPGEDVLFCAKVRSRWKDGLYFERAMQVRHFGRSRLREFWRHQASFGYSRGAYALELRPEYRRMGRNWLFAPAVAAKRLSYLLRCAAGHPASFAHMIVLSPLLLVGIVAWCIGFRRGCMEDGLLERAA